MPENELLTFESTILGRTGLRVGRLGVAASYGVPVETVERAFEQGVNYFYWGSRRTDSFAEALRHLAPKRERFMLVIQSYTRVAGLMARSLERALTSLRFDYADFLLLGMWNKPVPSRILDAARNLKERGLVKHLSVPRTSARLCRRSRLAAISTRSISAIAPRIPARRRTSSLICRRQTVPAWCRSRRPVGGS